MTGKVGLWTTDLPRPRAGTVPAMFERMAGPPGPYGVALALAAVGLASGCSSSQQSGSPRALPATTPPSSTTAAPHLTRPNSTTAGPRATEAAVVRQYFRIINHLDTDMNAAALARLMTPACPCHKLERSVRDEASHNRRYFGTVSLNRVQAHVDGPALGDVLVDFDRTVGGVRDSHGTILTRTPPRRHVNWDFVLVRRAGGWLINQINQT